MRINLKSCWFRIDRDIFHAATFGRYTYPRSNNLGWGTYSIEVHSDMRGLIGLIN